MSTIAYEVAKAMSRFRAKGVLAHRKRMADDPEMAAGMLLRFLRGRGWRTRRDLLTNTAFRRGEVLTAAADVLLARGEIETIRINPLAMGRSKGRIGTYYRIRVTTEGGVA